MAAAGFRSSKCLLLTETLNARLMTQEWAAKRTGLEVKGARTQRDSTPPSKDDVNAAAAQRKEYCKRLGIIVTDNYFESQWRASHQGQRCPSRCWLRRCNLRPSSGRGLCIDQATNKARKLRRAKEQAGQSNRRGARLALRLTLGPLVN